VPRVLLFEVYYELTSKGLWILDTVQDRRGATIMSDDQALIESFDSTI
jgi:hypothetical protein